MIEKLSGQLIAKYPTGVVIDVNGVGYGVEVPLSLLCELPPVGSRLELWIHTYVREDAIRLFGFASVEDRFAFNTLLEVSGVGPKVALAILSTLTISALRQAVMQQNTSLLEVVPGIGTRTAEKILVELKNKLKKLQGPEVTLNRTLKLEQNGRDFDLETSGIAGSSSPAIAAKRIEAQDDEIVYRDVCSALENLGFKERDIMPVLQRLTDTKTDSKELKSAAEKVEFNSLLKNALCELGGPKA